MQVIVTNDPNLVSHLQDMFEIPVLVSQNTKQVIEFYELETIHEREEKHQTKRGEN
jgi:hypothetical protein